MIKLIAEQTKPLSQIQKELNLNGMRLYRYAYGEVDIDKMPIKMFLDLCDYFKIEPYILYEKIKIYQKELKENE